MTTPIEERKPCGAPGLRQVELRIADHAYGRPFGSRVDLADCLVVRPKPFRIVIWEPLKTKAPAPPKAAPHCCYVQTVIFYHFPFIPQLKPSVWRDRAGRIHTGTRGYEEWDQVQSRLSFDDLVEFQDECFELGGGRVIWAQKRWWMCHGARRWQARAA